MSLGRIASSIIVFAISLLGTSVLIVRESQSLQQAAVATAVKISPHYAAGISLPAINTDGVKAESFIITTASEVVLKRQNAAARVPMASLTKIMTALILEERGENAVILLSDLAKRALPKQSSLAAGETITQETAKTLLLVESDNDVAEAIAAAIGPLLNPGLAPREAFIQGMNQKALPLGMANTHFENPTGLDGAAHYSTAADLAKLLAYIDRRYPNFWDGTATPPSHIQTLSGKSYKIKSSSLLVSYPGLLGIKTGLTDEALGALAIKYRLTEFPEDIYIILLRSPDRFRDGETLLNATRRAFQSAPK
ncbi:MAG: D-alanyl-D-alanine carboxypeptidase [Candidatus Sungbacteria bacterium]|uniref:D-alanyl-D-alanine carboxypeptidase n=1 Tax=Candidatus Sungiibacteriota bacterium TaxID=2750080 RepID=A0A931WMU8_9BACT|nr:D-alanyl-D-alanine carboxypeptidase [Candidatus Sungbacteria bacterium]